METELLSDISCNSYLQRANHEAGYVSRDTIARIKLRV